MCRVDLGVHDCDLCEDVKVGADVEDEGVYILLSNQLDAFMLRGDWFTNLCLHRTIGHLGLTDGLLRTV